MTAIADLTEQLDDGRKTGPLTEDKLEQLYWQYYDYTYNTISNHCREPQDARDVMADTWIRISQNWRSFRGGSFKTWMTTTAWRLLVDQVRSGHHRLREELSNNLCVRGDVATGAIEVMVCEALLDDIIKAPWLPDYEKDALLAVIEETNFYAADYALLFGLPETTACGRVNRARSKVQRFINRNENYAHLSHLLPNRHVSKTNLLPRD